VLTPTAKAILQALEIAKAPLARKEIAKAAGRKNNTHFYGVLMDLCSAGTVKKWPGHLYGLTEHSPVGA
jgi:hypothetical protein